ncbi:glycosyltransferase family 4 protein [Streptomyces sp. NPDC127074]|uniref:glycosyltransferase family 4 protein n=1 Tax=Streptomyces sp. NPDC127074 TaxID=3347130 RepID=UPI0036599C1D
MTGSLRVVARVHAYPPDHNAGAEWALHEMLRALVHRGHTAEVWLSQWAASRDPYETDGVRVIPHVADGRFATTVARSDVLVSHLENVSPTACLSRGYGKPLVVVCHNTFDLTWEPMTAGSTALAVVNSEWMRAEAERHFASQHRRPDRMLVVRPPVHAQEYRTRPGDSIALINCTATKGVGVLAELAERMPDRKFLAVRGGYGEQQPPDLPNVLVLDHMDGRRMRDEVYARTRVLLMPSDYESWGRVGVEALASGIPVLAHPTEGLTESLGAAGIFQDRNDVDAWVKAIEVLDDPATYRAVSRRAKARSRALDPTADLDAWCEAVEEMSRARAASR